MDNENNFQTLLNEKNETSINIYVLIHFSSCVNEFPASIFRDLMFSVSLGLRRIQLSDLAYNWPLCGI